MIAAMEILRPLNGLMAAAGFFIGAALSGFSLAPIPSPLLVGMIIVFLQSGAGMTFNDYFDWRIDRINRPFRVIPSGRMTLEGAMNYGAALFGVSIALSLLFLPIGMTALVLFNTAVSFLYSWKLKRTAAGHVVVSWLAASVFILASLLIGGLTEIALILFALVFCGNMAREIAKGVEDYKGDKAQGARTLAVSLGRDVAIWLAVMFAFLTIAIISLPYMRNASLLYSDNGYGLVAIFAAAALAYTCYLLYKNRPKDAQMAIKWAMIIVILALIIGLFF
jgi:geranylgeranylglycerol-phosphate geranylgeranyltransferase